MKFNQWTLALIAAFAICGWQTNAQTNLTSFPAWSSALTNYTPSKASFAARVDARAGYGINLTSHDPIAAAALSVSLAPSLAFGGVISHDSTGWCAGGLTIGINGSVQAPYIGTVDMFAGDGVAYDFHTHGAANYLFIGAERPFLIGSFRIAPGISLANTSTRAGTDLFFGISCRF